MVPLVSELLALAAAAALAGMVTGVLAGLRHQSELPPLSIGFVSAIGVLLIAPVSSWVAPIGARLAHALSRRALEIGFGLFLLFAAARFAVGALL